jgi:hypothetical protein
MLVFILLGAGVLSCCCCAGIGGSVGYYLYNAPPAISGNWESKDDKGRADILILFQDSGKGQFNRAAGKAHFFRWKAIDSKTVELEMTDSTDRLWTNENKSRFTYAITGKQLTLTATTGERREVRFEKID